MKTEHELRAEFQSMVTRLHKARGALRQLRDHVITRWVSDHVHSLEAGSEALARLLRNPVERQRLFKEIHTETVTARRRAAGAGLHSLRVVEQHVNDWRARVRATRCDVSLSFPDALNGVDPNGMIMLALLREHRRPTLMKLSVDALTNTYTQALPLKQSAAAFVDVEIIESMIDTGIGFASGKEDLSKLEKLRELVSDVQDLRLPSDLPDFESVAEDINRMRERASAAQLQAIDPERDPLAAAAYREQETALLGAGSPSDRDDLAAVQQELAAS